MKQHNVIEGTFTALVTPFDSQLRIDEQAWYNLLDHQAAGQVDGVIINGTTGESPTLSDQEFEYLLTSAKERLGKSVKIWAGSGGNVTEASIRKSKKAAELGADGLLLVTPYYNKPTQEGLKQHYNAIVNAVDLPVMLYNVPGRTGTRIATETIEEISRHPNVVATKEATGDMNQILDILHRAGHQCSVLSGDDAMSLPLVLSGGQGVVSVIANVAPGLMKSMVRDALDGNVEQARKAHDKLWPLMKASFWESNPIPIKEALAISGIIQPYVRLPLTRLDEAYRPQLQKVLSHLNLIE